MDILYSKHRYIVIIELSSTSIKFLKVQPKTVNEASNKYVISKYKYLETMPMNIKDLILNDFINIEDYKEQFLTKIVERFVSLSKLQVQMFRVMATGYYRNIKNATELFQVIENEFTKSMKDKGVKIELLSPDEESYLSFLSWKKTYKFDEKNKNFINEAFEFGKLGLNIDVGGGTTEITLFNNDIFRNTVSLPIGAEYLKDKIMSNEYLDHNVLWKEFSEIKKEVRKLLNENLQPSTKVDYVICTGSTLIIDADDEKNTERKLQKATIGHIIIQITDELSNRIEWKQREKQVDINKNELKILRKLCGFLILQEILNHCNVDSCYNNIANLRIGAYYQTKEQLVKLHRYKI